MNTVVGGGGDRTEESMERCRSLTQSIKTIRQDEIFGRPAEVVADEIKLHSRLLRAVVQNLPVETHFDIMEKTFDVLRFIEDRGGTSGRYMFLDGLSSVIEKAGQQDDSLGYVRRSRPWASTRRVTVEMEGQEPYEFPQAQIPKQIENTPQNEPGRRAFHTMLLDTAVGDVHETLQEAFRTKMSQTPPSRNLILMALATNTPEDPGGIPLTIKAPPEIPFQSFVRRWGGLIGQWTAASQTTPEGDLQPPEKQKLTAILSDTKVPRKPGGLPEVMV
ncbi:Uncharacterised protein [uncultured archaeon]|nr:Uncharacterised protein [uncultured archaeon]